MPEESVRIFSGAQEESVARSYAMLGNCYYCARAGKLLADECEADQAAVEAGGSADAGGVVEGGGGPAAGGDEAKVGQKRPREEGGAGASTDGADADMKPAVGGEGEAMVVGTDTLPPAAPPPADAPPGEFCTHCGSGDSLPGNEILLCDGLNCTRSLSASTTPRASHRPVPVSRRWHCIPPKVPTAERAQGARGHVAVLHVRRVGQHRRP